ncbi:MAG: pyridoxal phosphate-dependent aminotransferase [Candidatus Micrarchaeota archaeon]|nr:pyridoxal phosphate-dependent aminotransferase [Candidatus Micrarchaeota archaeon]
MQKRFLERLHLLSERIAFLPRSIFSKFIGLKGKGLISLGPGEPDFDTPSHIKEAAKRAIDENYTHYAPTLGYEDLLEEIGKKLKRKNNIKLEDPTKQICVTAGSTESLLLSMLCSFDATENVLIPNPGFVAYRPGVEIIDAVPVSYNLLEEEGFDLNIEDIKRKITPKTKGIIINSPSNPTGAVFSRSRLEELADIAVENNLMIISDEAYEDLVFDGRKHFSIASLNGMEEYVLSTFTFSKSYAMTGFRVGYVVGHEKLISQMERIHICTSISACSISQRAALAALKGPQDCVKEMAREYDRRRRFILKRISEIKGFEMKSVPQGAFFAFPRIRFDEIKYPFKEKSSKRFSLWLLEKTKVITVPGSEFGDNGEGFVRFSYATSFDKIEEAMDRFEKFLGSA